MPCFMAMFYIALTKCCKIYKGKHNGTRKTVYRACRNREGLWMYCALAAMFCNGSPCNSHILITLFKIV